MFLKSSREDALDVFIERIEKKDHVLYANILRRNK